LHGLLVRRSAANSLAYFRGHGLPPGDHAIVNSVCSYD
jgi:hypothetical protein